MIKKLMAYAMIVFSTVATILMFMELKMFHSVAALSLLLIMLAFLTHQQLAPAFLDK